MKQNITLKDKISSNQVIIGGAPVINFISEVEESVKWDLEGTCTQSVIALEVRLKTSTLLKRTPMLSMTSNFGMILKNAWRWINWRLINAWRWINWRLIREKSAVFCSI